MLLSGELLGDAVRSSAIHLLDRCPNRFAIPVLQPFFEHNNIDSEQFLVLNRMIREAREMKRSLRDNRIAWEGLAIFALYVYFQVTDLADIAEHLYVAKSTVKRWISAIYAAFDLAEGSFPDRAARRQELRFKALEEGYVQHTSWLRRIPKGLDNLITG